MKLHEGPTGRNDHPALVLFRPDRANGLWDPEMSALIDELEEELGVFVTCVRSGAGGLGLDEAAAAARFMGCPSMVVIAPEDSTPPHAGGCDQAGAAMPSAFVRSAWSARELVATYQSSRWLVRDAA